ncbi:MAG TPA: hypothetical protein VFO69_06610 [Allosphingosinicella sp.]|nr:hypothetical protein [Allosphingosinicella sp.]
MALIALACLAAVPTAQGFAQSAQPEAAKVERKSSRQRVVCHKAIDTGSLVKGRRQCTRIRAERPSDAAQRKAAEPQAEDSSRPAGQ